MSNEMYFIFSTLLDSHFTHLAWQNLERKQGGLGNINYPLLADKSMSISRAYGVLDEESGIPFRGLFIIDGKGNLRQITVNDLPVGRSVDETIRLVQAFQFTDERKIKFLSLKIIITLTPHSTDGEVCPANWDPKKNSKTMVPDPTRSKDYFSTSN